MNPCKTCGLVHASSIPPNPQHCITALKARFDATNDEVLDGTDFAHPAWWRGHDAAVSHMCALIHEWASGKGTEGTHYPEVQAARTHILKLYEEAKRP